MQPSPAPESHIEANFYQQGKDYDIKANALGNIYAMLELTFNLIRATTPKYTNYEYQELKYVGWDKSPAANGIRMLSRKKVKWTYVDMDNAYQMTGVSRSDLVSKLNTWNDDRFIELKAGGVVNVFRVTDPKKWPPSAVDRQKVIDSLYEEMQMREKQDLNRMDQVMGLITGKACFARTLAEHFGDTLPDNAQECGHCKFHDENPVA